MGTEMYSGADKSERGGRGWGHPSRWLYLQRTEGKRDWIGLCHWRVLGGHTRDTRTS